MDEYHKSDKKAIEFNHKVIDKLQRQNALLTTDNKRLRLALADVDLHAGSNLVQGIAREALKDTTDVS